MNPFVYGPLARERDRDLTRRLEEVARARRARAARHAGSARSAGSAGSALSLVFRLAQPVLRSHSPVGADGGGAAGGGRPSWRVAPVPNPGPAAPCLAVGPDRCDLARCA